MVPSAIATLSRTGLLVENRRQDSDSPVLFVLPVVQSFMQQQGRIGRDIQQDIQLSCSQYILDHDHQNGLSKIAAEDVNIQAILFSSPTTQHSNMLSDKIIDALISFSWYRCNDAKPNLEIAKHAVSMAKAFGNTEYIASSLWCLGSTYSVLGEFYAAYDHVHEAYQLYNSLVPSPKWYNLRKGLLRRKNGPRVVTMSPGDRELPLLCCQCGIDMVDAARMTFKDRDKVVSLARDVEKQAAILSDDDTHARSLILLGSVLNNYGDPKEALRHLERAKLMGIGTLNSEIYYRIAIVHYQERRLPEALDAAKEAWKLSEPDNDMVDQAQNSFVLGRILFSMNRDTEAMKYMEISLTKNLELGNRRESARTLEYMGYGYLRRGDYLNAYNAYESAAESYRGTVDEEAGSTLCKDNMAKIKDKQKNPELNVGFERSRSDNNWPSLFYPGAASV